MSSFIPLNKLAICLDDDAVFDITMLVCPQCGGGTIMPLGKAPTRHQDALGEETPLCAY